MAEKRPLVVDTETGAIRELPVGDTLPADALSNDFNVDGGHPDSVYVGVPAVDGGTP